MLISNIRVERDTVMTKRPEKLWKVRGVEPMSGTMLGPIGGEAEPNHFLTIREPSSRPDRCSLAVERI